MTRSELDIGREGICVFFTVGMGKDKGWGLAPSVVEAAQPRGPGIIGVDEAWSKLLEREGEVGIV